MSPISFDGEYYQVENIRVLPPPVQERPPIMIAGSGEKVTLRHVAKWADACNFNRGPLAGATRHKLEVLEAALRRSRSRLRRDSQDRLYRLVDHGPDPRLSWMRRSPPTIPAACRIRSTIWESPPERRNRSPKNSNLLSMPASSTSSSSSLMVPTARRSSCWQTRLFLLCRGRWEFSTHRRYQDMNNPASREKALRSEGSS